MVLAMNINAESVLVARRTMLNKERKVIVRSNSFASQQSVLVHVWNRPVRLVTEFSCLMLQLLVEMDRIAVLRITVATMEMSKSMASLRLEHVFMAVEERMRRIGRFYRRFGNLILELTVVPSIIRYREVLRFRCLQEKMI